MVTCQVLYPLLVKTCGKLNIGGAIFDRWARFMPPVMSIVALEFCFPLLGVGPMYQKISTNILTRCSKNWIYNVFFVSNFLTANEICAPHTFYSSIDLQLFILGCAAILLLYHRPKTGICVCLGMALGGMVYTFKIAKYHQTQHIAFTSELNLNKTLQYFEKIHINTICHFTNYFIGILIGYLVVQGFRFRLSKVSMKS